MIDNKQFLRLREKYDTPTFVFDIDEVKKRVENVRKYANLYSNGNIKICYSIKANPFLVRFIKDDVDALEVCSPGELMICKKLNVPAEKVIYSGVHKDLWDVREAVDYDAFGSVGEITCESIMHYKHIKTALADSKAQTVKVLLRLSSKSQFGMSKEDIETIITDNLSSSDSRIEIVGIHYFAGTQRVKLNHQKQEIAELLEFLDILNEKYSLNLKRFEYGPGFYYPYFEGEDFSDTYSPVKELAQDLARAASKYELTIEMGRFIAASCGYYMSEICDIKSSFGHNWCIVDGGINHVNYLGQMMGLKAPIIRHIKSKESDCSVTDTYAICGSLCTTNDVLVREYTLTNAEVSDMLVLENIGAYSITEGMNLFLSRTMPRVVAIGDGRDTLLRDRIESYELNC